ncbi:hypothetical protein [Methanocella conradii]|nr:hypothetical protein [Methanocella conradii]MDI6895935.1 hypothetical protein [Methanocella conradii]
MDEKPEKPKEGKKRKKKRKPGYNIEPAEELVKGPTGEEPFRV